jgi:hypothetical protein
MQQYSANRRVAQRCAWLVAAATGGCASTMAPQDKASFQTYLNRGDYRAAAMAAEQAGRITPDGRTQNIVWSLNAATALYAAGDMKTVIPILDTTERLAQNDDLDRMHAAIDYRYTTYDGVMTNVYKAMSFLALGDPDSARVEFNRSEDRQRRAEEYFRKEIAYQAAHNRAAGDPGFDALMRSAEQSPAYESDTAQLNRLAAYAPFENPFATYLAGIFFVSQGDFQRGIDRLKRAADVLGPASPAAADVKWAENQHRAGIRGTAAPAVWVVFENGQSATYHELRLVLPMVTGAPMTLALPVLTPNARAYATLRVDAGGTTVQTTGAGSFDAVMASEFSRRRQLILAESVAEVLAKNVLSVAAQKSNNGFLRLASNVVANVSTADTRSWIGLPKEFQVARLAVPPDGHVGLSAGDGAAVGEASVPVGRSSIVWVKAQQGGAHAAVEVFPLSTVSSPGATVITNATR